MPREPGLAGTVAAECIQAVPWISYALEFVGVDDPPAAPAVLALTDGASTLDIPLGVLEAEGLTGRIPWPGVDDPRPFASVRVSAVTDDLAWTRGDIRATVRAAGAELAVPLRFPAASATCVADGVAAAGLSRTGGMVPIGAAVAGGLALVGGLAALGFAVRRRRDVAARR
ncbi:MAG: hypothetical protein NT132_08490 [Microbacterium sp.]|uniref:hypothetical protein n=1 Tax=Microbacterium sp. TaxID=51671 RepID=UPI0026016637|nr:hypothetical protein [Microbacterium sp.]MCX6502425.1 hypothetical protein [Microbacterium sp.]